jgi:hypothetical protein
VSPLLANEAVQKTRAALLASRGDVIDWSFTPSGFLVSISAFCKRYGSLCGGMLPREPSL